MPPCTAAQTAGEKDLPSLRGDGDPGRVLELPEQRRNHLADRAKTAVRRQPRRIFNGNLLRLQRKGPLSQRAFCPADRVHEVAMSLGAEVSEPFLEQRNLGRANAVVVAFPLEISAMDHVAAEPEM